MKYYLQFKTLIDILKQRGIANGILTFVNAAILKIFNRIHYYPDGYGYPYIRSIQLEPTKLCNMACPMCLNPYLDKSEKGNLSYENFKKIIKQFPFLTTVRLQGLGESLLNPDIYKMIAYLKRKGVSVGFADNGTMLTPKTNNKLLGLKVNYISLSLDTLNREKFKIIRGVDLFDNVKEKIENLVKIKKGNSNYKTTRIILNMVLSNDNVNELSDMIDYAHKLGIKELIISSLQPKYLKQQKDYLKEISNELQNPNFMEGIYNHAKLKAKKYGIVLSFNILHPQRAIDCLWNFEMTYITWDGYLTPCCHIENPSIYNFGNILNEPFKKVWNNQLYRSYRTKHLDAVGVCRSCPHLQ